MEKQCFAAGNVHSTKLHPVPHAAQCEIYGGGGTAGTWGEGLPGCAGRLCLQELPSVALLVPWKRAGREA